MAFACSIPAASHIHPAAETLGFGAATPSARHRAQIGRP
jgi:hypothetical protein